MANTRSARKRIKQNEKRRLRNRAVRSAVRSSIKGAREALAGKSARVGRPRCTTPSARSTAR